MSWRMWAWVAVAAVLGSVPAVACGSQWPWPVDGACVLPYAAAWTDASGRTCSHGGLDIGSRAGAAVRACADGRIAFAGRVPAAEGGSVLAASVETGDGLRVTYMPLEQLAVAAGDAVRAGDGLGVLAASGDASTPAPHLHLSVRRGEAPIDPLTLLARPAEPAVPAQPAIPDPPAGPRPVSPLPAAEGAVRASADAVTAVRAAAGAPAPASAPAGAEAGGSVGPRVAVPLELGPRWDVRIRPLPARPRVDPRAAYDQLRAFATAGGGIAARLLLGALAVVLLARTVGPALRGAGPAPQAVPLAARARREGR